MYIDHLLDSCCTICRFMKDKVLPEDNICPSTHKKTTKSININLTTCTICEKDRYHSNKSGKKIPCKVCYSKPP